MIKLSLFILILTGHDGGAYRYPSDVPDMPRAQCQRVAEAVNIELREARARIYVLCVPKIEGL